MKSTRNREPTNHEPVPDVAEQGEQDAGDGDSRANVRAQHYQLLGGSGNDVIGRRVGGVGCR